ncbi:Origin recognition complex subunit 3 [Neolecta irregularis DAH-3]|uniref:Origin recognition complex subunit 3 n=1 Tax=Neolecta irregularis (strain DAH-3) TaxID=1198029 RepID=A0A1U7LN91_NEOID|nr:Origin recognition complex subunit 3 [Neolecta irregularis DAH-3]|eukprot:OLL24136.1 Origin recognition complex subunit 3 [Neolecta irregularis DAH-3]
MPITTDSTSSLTQSCFIIRPPRSLKKRTFADIVPSIFPTGLAGREDTETTLLRNKLYNDLWSSQKRKIENIFESIHSEGTEQVVNYISGGIITFFYVNSKEHVTEKLECGILLLGPNIAGHAKLFDRLSDLLSATKSTLCVSVSFRNFPNLKAGLKYIIKSVLGTTDFDDSDDELSTKKASGPGYSLSTLIPLFQNSYSRFTIAIQDAEAFDPSLLEQLIRHLYIFRDRLPLTLLLGISTPLSLFDSGFPGILHSLISTRLFDLEHTNKIMTSIILNVKHLFGFSD